LSAVAVFTILFFSRSVFFMLMIEFSVNLISGRER
jgi:hypothetical protein